MYKKIKITSAIIVILLTFPFHFMYQFKPNFLTAIFFPINESIWEHLKLFITPALIAFIVEMLIMKKQRICIQNNYLALLTEIAISIGTFLTIFLPFYFKMGENIFFTITVMIASIIFSKYLGYLLVKEKNELILNYLALIILFIVIIINIIFTFHPLNNYLFVDPITNQKGLPK